MDDVSIKLAWPPSILSPNAKRRSHWRKYAPATKAYRQACAWEAIAQGVRKVTASALHLSITFCPPDARRRDLDGMLGSIKAGLDGLADAMGVDDSAWSLSIRKGDPVKGGAVLVTISRRGNE